MNEQPTPEKNELHKILNEMAEEAVECTETVPSNVPITSKRKGKQVEVIPGIMVSQRLIDEAVRLTSAQGSDLQTSMKEVIEERRRERIVKDAAELREDIDKSREVVFAMLQRMREPLKYEEKFVSYDTMPGPLQRVIKAYIEAEEANRNLTEAVAALGKDLQPPVAKPE